MRISGSASLTKHSECGGSDGEREEGCRCTSLCPCQEETAPVLLLALGNPLMSDDGAGQQLLSNLESEAAAWGPRVEFVDGGTQGLALLGKFDGRKAVVFLDAIRLGDQAGAVHILDGAELVRMGRGAATTAHEGSAPQILAALQLLGEVPREVAMIGIEPEQIRTGMDLSAPVEASLGVAAAFARTTVNNILTKMGQEA
jgi:hydrogenase maturation protease